MKERVLRGWQAHDVWKFRPRRAMVTKSRQLLGHQMQLEGRALSRERTRPFFQRRRRVMFPSPRSAPALVHSLGG